MATTEENDLLPGRRDLGFGYDKIAEHGVLYLGGLAGGLDELEALEQERRGQVSGKASPKVGEDEDESGDESNDGHISNDGQFFEPILYADLTDEE